MKTKSNTTVSHQLELVGVVSWTWVGLGFDNNLYLAHWSKLYAVTMCVHAVSNDVPELF